MKGHGNSMLARARGSGGSVATGHTLRAAYRPTTELELETCLARHTCPACGRIAVPASVGSRPRRLGPLHHVVLPACCSCGFHSSAHVILNDLLVTADESAEVSSRVALIALHDRLPAGLFEQGLLDARCQAHRGDVASARAVVDKLVELFPDSADVHCAAGWIEEHDLGGRGQARARRHYLRGLAIEPSHVPAWQGLVRVGTGEGDDELTGRIALHALLRDPKRQTEVAAMADRPDAVGVSSPDGEWRVVGHESWTGVWLDGECRAAYADASVAAARTPLSPLSIGLGDAGWLLPWLDGASSHALVLGPVALLSAAGLLSGGQSARALVVHEHAPSRELVLGRFPAMAAMRRSDRLTVVDRPLDVVLDVMLSGRQPAFTRVRGWRSRFDVAVLDLRRTRSTLDAGNELLDALPALGRVANWFGLRARFARGDGVHRRLVAACAAAGHPVRCLLPTSRDGLHGYPADWFVSTRDLTAARIDALLLDSSAGVTTEINIARVELEWMLREQVRGDGVRIE